MLEKTTLLCSVGENVERMRKNQIYFLGSVDIPCLRVHATKADILQNIMDLTNEDILHCTQCESGSESPSNKRTIELKIHKRKCKTITK